MFNEFGSIYKGEVMSNTGTGSEGGRCKIFVPGVFPSELKKQSDMLPWAEPAAPLFGGSFSGSGVKTGICGWPVVGAHVWVFFEHGNHNRPVYFAAIQGEAGWSAENANQWVIKSNRFSLTIDEGSDSDRLVVSIDGNEVLTVTGDRTENTNGDLIQVTDGNHDETIEGDQTSTITGSQTIKASTSTFNNDVSINGNLTVKGNVTVTGDVSVTGNITLAGNMTVTGGDVIADGVSLKNHTHSGVTSGPSVTGPPVV